MGQDPSQIRQDIEQTREEMGNTVEALGHKTDVTGRAKEAVSDKVDTLRSKVSGTTDSEDVKLGARRAAGMAQENPLGLGIAALGAGFLAGLLIPGTKMEDEKIGPVASFRSATIVKRLPKTRSGKIVRGTIKKIADGMQYTVPATIDDPATLTEIATDLGGLGYGSKPSS